MKSIVSLSFVLVFSGFGFAQDEKDKSFFDMENCEICQCMKSLDMSKIKWEHHDIDNGMLMLTIVPDGMKDQWATCEKSMGSMIEKVSSGHPVKMCGFCAGFGELMQAGAKKQEMDTAGGKIMLVTSDDPEVVRKIHQLSAKIKKEHAKMEKMMMEMKKQDG